MADIGHAHDSEHDTATLTTAPRRGSARGHTARWRTRQRVANPLVDMQTTAPRPKRDDPGIGLRDNGRRVLTYADLSSAFEDPEAGSRHGRSSCT